MESTSYAEGGLGAETSRVSFLVKERVLLLLDERWKTFAMGHG